MNQKSKSVEDHQAKLKRFKQAIEDNAFAINSYEIAEALLEAQKIQKKRYHPIREPELV